MSIFIHDIAHVSNFVHACAYLNLFLREVFQRYQKKEDATSQPIIKTLFECFTSSRIFFLN